MISKENLLVLVIGVRGQCLDGYCGRREGCRKGEGGWMDRLVEVELIAEGWMDWSGAGTLKAL